MSIVKADGKAKNSERRLAGSKNQSVATYRELMGIIATRTNPNGGAIALILEKWISTILAQVALIDWATSKG